MGTTFTGNVVVFVTRNLTLLDGRLGTLGSLCSENGNARNGVSDRNR